MIQEPWFWRSRAPAARALALALAPGAAAYAAARRLKDAAVRPASTQIPVVCVGNATLGGVGKTPFALMLARMLRTHGWNTYFLSRGYGGALKGPLLVDPSRHDARDVGDEALLLANAGPAVVSRDRAAGVALAAANGADIVVMDDGFQNLSIEKALSLLLIDASDPCGNGMTFPAGPLREEMREAIARADAVVFVGDGRAAEIPGAERLPLFRARVAPLERRGGRVLAFCGIGAPDRFFNSLKEAGCVVVETRSFADHRFFTASEIAGLKTSADAASARLVTTAKDFARLPADQRDGIEVLEVAMTVDDPDKLLRLVKDATAAFRTRAKASP